MAEVVLWSTTAGLLSEGPRWHEEAGELLWVDILGATFHRGAIAADGGLDLVASVAIDRHVGAVAPAVGGGYVLAAGTGFLFVDAAGRVSELAQPEAGRTDVRMNDGACDPQGRFWAGTMAYDESPETRCALPAGAGWQLHDGLDRPDHLQRHRLEPRRRHHVPGRQRDRPRRGVRLRRWQRSHQRAPHPRAHRPARGGPRRAHRRRRTGRSGWRCGVVARSSGTPPTDHSWPRCACPSSDRPRARSGDLIVPRCSSPPPGLGSMRPPSPASPTPATCSGSTASAFGACPARRTGGGSTPRRSAAETGNAVDERLVHRSAR